MGKASKKGLGLCKQKRKQQKKDGMGTPQAWVHEEGSAYWTVLLGKALLPCVESPHLGASLKNQCVQHGEQTRSKQSVGSYTSVVSLG